MLVLVSALSRFEDVLMAIFRTWAFILFFAIASCAAQGIRSSYQIYPVRAPSAATSFAKLGAASTRVLAESYAETSDAPIRLTASDGTGLDLASLRVRTIIDGPLAFTELKMAFHNPRKRELEGRFEITLPDSAQVARLAMRQGDSWQDAEVVARRRAEQVYESYLHRQVDPVLLEASAGNRFRARVYPIPARGDKEIIISYSEVLPASGDYELFLAGLPMMSKLDLDVHRGSQRERFVKRDYLSPDNLVLPGDTPVASAERAGELIMMHWIPEAGVVADVPDKLVVLVDSSASAAGIYGQEVRSLQALAKALATSYGDKLELEVGCYDNEVQPIFAGLAKDYGASETDTLLAHGALGASNLEAALRWAEGRGHRVLLLGDGIATRGARSFVELAKVYEGGKPARIDSLSFASARDTQLLGRISRELGTRSGVVLAASQSAEDWARALGYAAPEELRVEVAGATWIWPERVQAARAGEGVIAFAKFEAEGAARLSEIRVQLESDKGPSELRLPVREGEQALIRRQWASVQLAALAAGQEGHFSELRQDKLEELSHRFRVLTASTSFLMLETDYDYAMHGIDRQESSEILTVDATGLRRLRHGVDGDREIHWQEVIARPYGTQQVTFANPLAASQGRPASDEGEGDLAIVDGGEAGAASMAGTVRDRATGDALVGVTVIAVNSAAQGNYNAISDEQGRFKIANLPEGRFELILIYGAAKARYSDIALGAGKSAHILAKLDLSRPAGEVQEIRGRALIDTTKTTQGMMIERSYVERVPIPGRTFESALSSMPGAQADGVGVSFSGSTSLEHQYVVDGVNTTGLSAGTIGAPSSHSQRPPRSESAEQRRFRSLRAKLATGALAEALEQSLRWSAQSPTNLLALCALGEALLANGHYKLAARAFASILDLYPSRADMHRVAAGYLARLGETGKALGLDALRFANERRPDHAHGLRLLAMQMAVDGQEKAAIELLLRGLAEGQQQDNVGVARFAAARELLRHEAGVIAAAWLARQPDASREIKALLDEAGIMVPMEAERYAVLSWESDVARLDLLAGRKGTGSGKGGPVKGRRFQAGNIGYGPAAILLEEELSEPVHFDLDFADQAMMGYAFAQLQLITLDGKGRLHVETRPTLVLDAHERVAMGGF